VAASRSDRFARGSRRFGRSLGPRTGLDAMERRQTLCPVPTSTELLQKLATRDPLRALRDVPYHFPSRRVGLVLSLADVNTTPTFESRTPECESSYNHVDIGHSGLEINTTGRTEVHKINRRVQLDVPLVSLSSTPGGRGKQRYSSTH
jgi:hypothetical protein